VEEALKRNWDVIVVGAGPAGSVVARELARRGAGVLLVDKATFPRAKVCGCCLNGSALAALENIGLGHVPARHGAIPLRKLKLAAGPRSADVPLPAGVALSRSALDAALVREAEVAGVAFLSGMLAKLEDEAEAERRTITLHDGSRHRSRIVILATGLASSNSPAEAGSRLGAGCIVPADLAPAFFDAGIVYMAAGRGGYVGLVRLEDGRLDIGAAFDAAFVRSSGGLGSAAAAILNTTCLREDTSGLRLDASHLDWKGTPALTRRSRAVAGHRFFAVGDAAGYVEPFTGEGMAWAVSSAAALAPIAHQAAMEWDDRYIRDWRRAQARVVGRRQGICRVAAAMLRSPLITGLTVRALAAFPTLARPVTTMLNRPTLLPEWAS
jgi:flavin-dependent dehydrogenase